MTADDSRPLTGRGSGSFSPLGLALSFVALVVVLLAVVAWWMRDLG